MNSHQIGGRYSLPCLLLVCAACGETDPVGPTDRVVPLADLLKDSVAVVENPSGRVPLAALASFTTRVPVGVRVRVLGPYPAEHGVETPDTVHAIVILGLFAGQENRVELRLSAGDGRIALDTLTIRTAPLPEFFPTVAVTVADTGRLEPGWTMVSFSVGDGGDFRTTPLMFDHSGTVRWFLDLSELDAMAFAAERLRNGNLIVGAGRAVHEYDMLGNQIRTWSLTGYWYHHDVIEKPDGNLLVAVDKAGLATVEDHLIELDRATGVVVREWDVRSVLDMYRRAFSQDATDWFHMNALWFDPSDDGIIVSGQRQGVVKLDRDGRVLWILAPHRGWGRAGPDRDGPDTSGLLLTAVDGQGIPYPEAVQDGAESAPGFDWSWGQHAVMLLPNGNLFLFDNGLNRNFTGETQFSRGVEYAVDEAARTIRQVWEYGPDRGSSFYSPIVSDVDHLPLTGHRLISPGIVFGTEPRAFVTEVTEAGEVVFEGRLTFKNARSTGSLEWGQFDLAYRSERMTLYP